MPISRLGVCYYPEHWPREHWPAQAATMREAGIELVRIGEFAWSRIEPQRDRFDWEWMDTAIETLAAAGLQVIMCTPTACPPRWLVEECPEILPVDHRGQRREFGSRRHYRFASLRYREESRRICARVIDRYFDHPAVVGWQTDNEYGCHDTTRSYAADDRSRFQDWLRDRYRDIGALNEAWGTVFWSQEYGSFSDIGLPNLTVTEANPAHRLDFWRFASEQVRDFNREQVRLLRRDSPTRPWLTHNCMGNFTDFDHFDIGADLDVASWDSYPLGFLDQGWASDAEKLRYRQIGRPDWAAFHHDLYRAVGGGRLAVMEQQPGPVNWAPANALPLASAPAFWGMEAVAHGAEFVSFFRFQQLPVAQEQMHAGLRLPNGQAAPAWSALKQFAEHCARLPEEATQRAPVALLFDYPSCWSTAIQPHAPGAEALRWAMEYYSAVRRLGVDVDIIATDAELDGYAALLIPGCVFLDEALVERIEAAGIACVAGARSGSRSANGALPPQLAPGPLQRLLPVRVQAVDSMRSGAERRFWLQGEAHAITQWYEVIDSSLAPRVQCDDGLGFWYQNGRHHYLNAYLAADSLAVLLRSIFSDLGLETVQLPEGLRLRRRGSLSFAFNFAPRVHTLDIAGAQMLIGDGRLEQGEYAVWTDA